MGGKRVNTGVLYIGLNCSVHRYRFVKRVEKGHSGASTLKSRHASHIKMKHPPGSL